MKTILFFVLLLAAAPALADQIYSKTDIGSGVQAAIAALPEDAHPQSLKVWQTLGNLEFAFQFSDRDPIYIMCHFHDGDHMDCHQRSRPGPNEP